VALYRPDAADWHRVADEVLSEDVRMARLVDELLLLARSDEGQLAHPSVACDLLDVARSVVASGEYEGSRVTCVVRGTPTPVLVPEVYLERMIGNLVDNARRFATSRVEVVVEHIGPSAQLHVRDDGPGIPVAERDRVFERFVRADEARDRENGGFGLGLAIVADLCRAYSGTVDVADAAPGAIFSIRFPVAPATLEHPRGTALVADLLAPARR
jgi:signal transduction histidine kinase